MNGLPQISARRSQADRLELDFTLGADCPWLQGHFPGQPILPGVVQVGWAAEYAGQLVACQSPPMQLHRIKFKRPILPGARLTLVLTADDAKVRFEYRLRADNGDVTASSGVLVMDPA